MDDPSPSFREVYAVSFVDGYDGALAPHIRGALQSVVTNQVYFGSTYFFQTPSPESRFISWVAKREKLELVELSSNKALSQNMKTLVFEDPIVSQVSFIEIEEEGTPAWVLMFVISEAGLVKRFRFPHPYRGGLGTSSVLGLVEEVVERQIRMPIGSTCSVSCAISDTLVALVASSKPNVIICATLPPAKEFQVELSEENFVSRYITGFFQTTKPYHILDMVAVRERAIFCLCNDGALRVWTAPNVSAGTQLICTYQLQTSGSQINLERGSLRVQHADNDPNEVEILVYYSSQLAAQFEVLSASLEPESEGKTQAQISLQYTVPALQKRLKDAMIVAGSVWAIWEQENESSLRRWVLGANEGWEDVNTLSHELDARLAVARLPEGVPAMEFYVDQLLRMEGSNAFVVGSALRDLQRELGLSRDELESEFRRRMEENGTDGNPLSVLREELRATLSLQIEREAALTNVPQSVVEEHCASSFHHKCQVLMVEAQRYCGLGFCGLSEPCVLKLDGVSLVRTCGAVERLSFASSKDLASSNKILTASRVFHQLPELAGFSVTVDYNGNVDEVRAVADALVHTVLSQHGGEDRKLCRQVTLSVSRLLFGMENFEEEFNAVFEMLEPDQIQRESEPMGAGAVLAAVLNSYRQIVRSNYSLCKDLLLLCKYLVRSHTQLAEEGAAIYIQDTAIPKLWSLVWTYRTLDWIGQLPVKPKMTHNEVDLKQLGLDISSLSLEQTATIDQAAEDGAVLTVLCKNVAIPVNEMEGEDSIRQRAVALINFVSFYDASTPSTSFISEGKSLLIAKLLFQYGQIAYFIEWVNLTGFSKSSSFQHMLGYAYLHLSQFERAEACFLRATALDGFAIGGAMGRMAASGKSIAHGSLEHYVNIIQQFERADQLAISLKFAYAALAIPKLDSNETEQIWLKIWKFALKLKRFDEAYNAMVSMPSLTSGGSSEKWDIRKECLRKFVLDLLEQRKIRKLASYPWVGLRPQVVDVLARKAANTDFSELFVEEGASRRQPNYYNILYSFLLDSHNYAKAGECMYRFAMRIGREADVSKPIVLRRQADVLLLVVSALQMAPPNSSWMLHTEQESLHDFNSDEEHNPAFPMANKRRKFGRGGQLVYVDLELVEKRYLLCMARLELMSALAAAGSSAALPVDLSPKDLVLKLQLEGLIDHALNIALKFDMSLEPILLHLTDKCLQLQNLGRWDAIPSELDIKFEEPIRRVPGGAAIQVPARALDKATQGWSMLASYLTKYDSVDTNYKYRVAVADRILSSSDCSVLPLWFINIFKVESKQKPGNGRLDLCVLLPLLRLMLKYHLLDEACTLTIESLQGGQPQGVVKMQGLSDLAALSEKRFGSGSSGKKAVLAGEDQKWVPWVFLEELLATLDGIIEANSNGFAKKLRSQLMTEVDKLR